MAQPTVGGSPRLPRATGFGTATSEPQAARHHQKNRTGRDGPNKGTSRCSSQGFMASLARPGRLSGASS